MKASILDLRYKMKDVLKALERNETVEILYHGKLKGILSPVSKKPRTKHAKIKVSDHSYFGMNKNVEVDKTMRRLRGGRFNDL